MRDPYIWLLPTIKPVLSADRLRLVGPTTDIPFDSNGSDVLRCLTLLDGTRPLSVLRSAHPVLAELVNSLDEAKLIVKLTRRLDELVAEEPMRSRQLSYFAHQQQLFPDRAFEELARASVLVVGVGGVGSYAAAILAGSGVGKLILSDPDVVDASNLNRQILYGVSDIGQPKVEAARRALLARYPKLAVETSRVDHDVAKEEVLPRADLILVSGERVSVWDRPELVGATPMLMAGYFGQVAVVGPTVDPARGTPCWPCAMSHHRKPADVEIDADAVKLERGWNSSGAAINALAGSLLGEAATRFLAPSLGPALLLSERLEIDTTTLEVTRRPLETPRRPACPLCRRAA